MHLFAIIFAATIIAIWGYNSMFQILFLSQPPFKWLYGVCYDNIFNLGGGERWSGGADRDWTCYLIRARDTLSQMSYSPKTEKPISVLIPVYTNRPLLSSRWKITILLPLNLHHSHIDYQLYIHRDRKCNSHTYNFHYRILTQLPPFSSG